MFIRKEAAARVCQGKVPPIPGKVRERGLRTLSAVVRAAVPSLLHVMVDGEGTALVGGSDQVRGMWLSSDDGNSKQTCE